MVLIRCICLVICITLLLAKGSWINVARKLFRLQALPVGNELLRNSEVGQLKEKISIVYDENAELKKMVRYSKLQVQVLRKEIDALRKAYRTEMEEMYNQSIANEDELRNDLLSAANEEMNMVVKDLTTRFEEEKQWLVSNLTETHHIDIAKLKENLRSYEIGTKDLESRIQELKDELQSVTLGNTVHRDQELMSHQHEICALKEELSRQQETRQLQASSESADSISTSIATAPQDQHPQESGFSESIEETAPAESTHSPVNGRPLCKEHTKSTGVHATSSSSNNDQHRHLGRSDSGTAAAGRGLKSTGRVKARRGRSYSSSNGGGKR